VKSIREYRARKRALEQQKREHLAAKPAGCVCPWCLGTDEVHRILMERARADSAAHGAPPF
jgi:hypothetical protein